MPKSTPSETPSTLTLRDLHPNIAREALDYADGNAKSIEVRSYTHAVVTV